MLKNAKIVVSLKYLSNFWRLLEMLLINCKVELILWWTKNCVLAKAGPVNTNIDSNNIILLLKIQNLYK